MVLSVVCLFSHFSRRSSKDIQMAMANYPHFYIRDLFLLISLSLFQLALVLAQEPGREFREGLGVSHDEEDRALK